VPEQEISIEKGVKQTHINDLIVFEQIEKGHHFNLHDR